MIHFHGWGDPVIQPRSSVDYYDWVIDAQRREERGDSEVMKETRKFYRLFMVPGMVHCLGGPGPNAFGQAPGTPASVQDPDHNVMLALEQWVEQGTAPDRIIATHYMNHNPTQGIDMQRPLCPYPEVARYTGSGDTTNAANFVCVEDEPDQQRSDDEHHR